VEEPGDARHRAVIVDGDSPQRKSCQSVRGGHAFDLGPILAAVGVFRIKEFIIKAGFIAEEKQAFGISIEPPERIDSARQSKIGERAPARTRLGGELREDAVGFVKGEKHAMADREAVDAGRVNENGMRRVGIQAWRRRLGEVSFQPWRITRISLRALWLAVAASGFGR
jgi:hypothetical protein